MKKNKNKKDRLSKLYLLKFKAINNKFQIFECILLEKSIKKK